jgi:hypothetical protein
LALNVERLAAQVTVPNNNVTTNEYVGCNNQSTQPLRFTTVLNFPHIWRTNNTQRMRLNQNVSTAVNGWGSTAKNGFLGLSPNGSLWDTGPGIFSRLHLDDATGVLTSTYRPWMRNGVYMSGNMDMMYVGQLFRTGDDESDAVVAWGDNKYAPAGPDHLRFIFMGSGFEGEEVTRINGDGFHGLGNFDAAGQNPDERLDC